MPSRARYARTRHSGTHWRKSVLQKLRAPWLQWPGGARTLWTHLGAALLLLWLLPSAAQAQAGTPAKSPQVESASADGKLELVVALFRHGVRAPLEKFAKEQARKHSRQDWPSLSDWKVSTPGEAPGTWGDLTKRGKDLAKSLGARYVVYYKAELGPGFKAYLWTDVDQRNCDTGAALKEGLEGQGVAVQMAPRDDCKKPAPKEPDPLFHPFGAQCGKPDPDKLKPIADGINEKWRSWANDCSKDFDQLYYVLDCNEGDPCVRLSLVNDEATFWRDGQKRGSSPIQWQGQAEKLGAKHYAGRFPYASSASEAFLLEYANGMAAANQVGWRRVAPPNNAAHGKLQDMLKLHEFYFDQTEREPYLATIGGSNLIKEILDLLRAKADWAINGCPHAGTDKQFVGLVGHDTSLASVGKLLDLTWSFKDQGLTDVTKDLPANDALPAGALVFELRKRPNPNPPDEGYFVRVYYVTQSLDQMARHPEKTTAFVLNVKGAGCQGSPCDIPLIAFNQLVANVLSKEGKEFLSHCTQKGEQVCK